MDAEPHLLIVDDDERIRGLLQKFLARNGFYVSAARDAAHARRLYRHTLRDYDTTFRRFGNILTAKWTI